MQEGKASSQETHRAKTNGPQPTFSRSIRLQETTPPPPQGASTLQKKHRQRRLAAFSLRRKGNPSVGNGNEFGNESQVGPTAMLRHRCQAYSQEQG